MSSHWSLVARYVRSNAGAMMLVLALALVSVAIEALLPWPLEVVIDHVLPGKPLPAGLQSLPQLAGSRVIALAWCAGALLAVFVIHELVQMAKAVVQARLSARMQLAVAGDLLDRLQALAITFHARSRRGDLARRVTHDTDAIPTLLTGVVVPALTACGALALFFGIMWELDHGLALAAMLVAMPMGVIMRVLGPRMSQRAYEHSLTQGEVWSVSEQTLTAIPVVQAFGAEEHEGRRFRGVAQRTIRAYLRNTATQLEFKMGVEGCQAIGTALVLLLGGYKVLAGTLSVGSLVVFLSYLVSLYAPLLTFAYLSSTVAAAAGGARRVMEIEAATETVEDAPHAQELPTSTGRHGSRVRFDNVSFAYRPGTPVLRHIDLDVLPGETVAIVGATGAGKTTLVSLVLRLIDPAEGRVLIDGQDVRASTLASVRARVGMVLQDPFLLPLSIAENIRFGRPEATFEEIEQAARRANAEEFIVRLPRGYDTIIGERGATLSGGQRQRIAIARALVKDAPILILDEPTSALDVESEQHVMGAIEELMHGRTTIVIAHRLSTIARADRVVVLDHGTIAETGTHAELIASGGPFHRLWLAQAPRHAAMS